MILSSGARAAGLVSKRVAAEKARLAVEEIKPDILEILNRLKHPKTGTFPGMARTGLLQHIDRIYQPAGAGVIKRAVEELAADPENRITLPLHSGFGGKRITGEPIPKSAKRKLKKARDAKATEQRTKKRRK